MQLLLPNTKVNMSKTTVALFEEKNGRLHFHEKNLSLLLSHESLKSKPISVLSIAGAFRTGKSFFLNLILKYFRKKGWESKNKNWLDSWNSSTDSEIPWRPGVAGDTQGIVALKDPLIVKRKDGSEVALILLDTQGNFDHQSKRVNNVKVFALSTLFSSMQIFNISKQIQENDLDYLECFVEFAKEGEKLSASNTDTGIAESREDKIFQDLLFLVRDWPNEAEVPYGHDGGIRYLQSIAHESDHLLYIKKAFSNVTCFLMPEPERGVRNPKSKKPSLKSSDLGVEFMDFVTKFADRHLRPSSLQEKRLGSWLSADANELFEFMKNCASKILDESVFEIPNMIQLQSEHVFKTVREREIKSFNEEMTKIVNEMTEPDWDLLDIRVSRLKAGAIRKFHENTRFGSNSDSQDLEKDLMNAKTELETKMRQRRYEYAKTLIDNWHKESIGKIENHPKGWLYTNPKEYEEIHDDCMRGVFQEHDRDPTQVLDGITKAKEKFRAACNEMKSSATAHNKKVLCVGLGVTLLCATFASPAVAAAIVGGELVVGIASGVSVGLVALSGYFSKKY